MNATELLAVLQGFCPTLTLEDASRYQWVYRTPSQTDAKALASLLASLDIKTRLYPMQDAPPTYRLYLQLHEHEAVDKKLRLLPDYLQLLTPMRAMMMQIPENLGQNQAQILVNRLPDSTAFTLHIAMQSAPEKPESAAISAAKTAEESDDIDSTKSRLISPKTGAFPGASASAAPQPEQTTGIDPARQMKQMQKTIQKMLQTAQKEDNEKENKAGFIAESLGSKMAEYAGPMMKVLAVLVVVIIIFVMFKGFMCPDFATAQRETYWFCGSPKGNDLYDKK